jgi:hypothetical protein
MAQLSLLLSTFELLKALNDRIGSIVAAVVLFVLLRLWRRGRTGSFFLVQLGEHLVEKSLALGLNIGLT